MSQYRCRACVFPVDCTDPPGYIQIIVRTERQTPPAFLNHVLRIASSVPYLILIDIAYSRIGGTSKIDPLFLPPPPTAEVSPGQGHRYWPFLPRPFPGTVPCRRSPSAPGHVQTSPPPGWQP